MMRDLKAMGFRFSSVLADSLYGRAARNVPGELKAFAVAIRSAIMQSGCRANKRFGIIDGEKFARLQ